MVFTDEKLFCLTEPNNISSYFEHRDDSVIAPHRVKHQMIGGGIMVLGAITNFVVIKNVKGKYNCLKYFYDVQTTFISWCHGQFD